MAASTRGSRMARPSNCSFTIFSRRREKPSSLSTGMLSPQLRYRYQPIEVVCRGGLIPFFRTANLAAVQNSVAICLDFHGYRPHESAAVSLPVAGHHINMATPQTTRTMVGVACALDGKTTLPANEIFYRSLKMTAHAFFALSRRERAIWRSNFPMGNSSSLETGFQACIWPNIILKCLPFESTP